MCLQNLSVISRPKVSSKPFFFKWNVTLFVRFTTYIGSLSGKCVFFSSVRYSRLNLVTVLQNIHYYTVHWRRVHWRALCVFRFALRVQCRTKSYASISNEQRSIVIYNTRLYINCIYILLVYTGQIEHFINNVINFTDKQRMDFRSRTMWHVDFEWCIMLYSLHTSSRRHSRW